MRHKLVLPIAFFIVSIVPAAHARTGHWRDVMRLRAGTPISVKPANESRVLCIFVRATKNELSCDRFWSSPPPYVPPIESRYRFDRRIVREVRLEHSDRANAAIGMGVGAGIGAGLGEASSARGLGAVIFGALGAYIGKEVGRDAPLFHRKVIYKR